MFLEFSFSFPSFFFLCIQWILVVILNNLTFLFSDLTPITFRDVLEYEVCVVFASYYKSCKNESRENYRKIKLKLFLNWISKKCVKFQKKICTMPPKSPKLSTYGWDTLYKLFHPMLHTMGQKTTSSSNWFMISWNIFDYHLGNGVLNGSIFIT